MGKTLAFTGLRPQKLSFKFDENHTDCLELKIKMKDILVRFIENDDVCNFISGLALGIDQIAAQIIINLKDLYPEIKLEAAIPCLNQEKLWSQEYKYKYNEILKKCDDVHYCSEKEYWNGCMQMRNEFMVDKADIVFAVWDEQYGGGTSSTVKYARERNKRLLILHPKSLDLRKEF